MQKRSNDRIIFLPVRKMKKVLSWIIVIVLMTGTILVTNPSPVFGLSPQNPHANQKKINKERERRAKENRKQYEQAVKRHYDNQSKETKKQMKQARKDAKKNTPLK